MNKLKIIFLFLFLFSQLSFYSQSLEFENFTTKNGLLSDDVYKIFQDKNGYIWFFTNYGAMKYNGNKFEQVLKNLPFEESFMYSYYENSKGRKWVANSNAKIYEILGDSAVLVPGITELSDQLKLFIAEIRQLSVDEKDNIYINTKSGAFKIVTRGIEKWHMLENNENDTAFVLLQDIDNTLFSAIDTLIPHLRFNHKYRPLYFKLKYTDRQHVTKTFKFSQNNIHFAYPINFIKHHGEIYFSYQDRVAKINRSGVISDFNAKSYVLHFCIDNKNRLWVATLNNGLLLYDEYGKLVAHYFEGKTVNHVLLDTQNGLWITTEGLGIFHCRNIDEAHFNSNEPLGNPINILKKIDHRLFIGTSTGEIDIVETGNEILLKIFDEKNTYLQDIIKCNNAYLICSRDKNLGLLKIQGKPEIKTFPTIKPGFSSTKIYKLAGDSILLYTHRCILILKNGLKDIENEKENFRLCFDGRLFCFELRGNEKMFGTDDGVYVFRNNRFQQPKYLLPLKKIKIVSIVKGNDNNYWLCSKGRGLFKLTTSNQLINYDISKNLPSDVVNSIGFTPKNEVLLSTNKGLFYSGTPEMKKWVELLSGQVNSTEIINNKIYCATKKGLVIINKDGEFENKKIYFNLAGVYVNRKKMSLNSLRNLTYDKNNIDFYFDAISFSKSFYDIKFHLIGSQNFSGIISNHQLSFQKLPPGNYRLTAILLDGNRLVDKIQMEFDIIPAFWQTAWFKVVSSIFVVVICIMIIWLSFKRYKRRIDKKNEINRLIIEYKLIALKAQINPHFMSNCLTAIQHLILSNKINAANKYLAKFSYLVRSVLQFSSKGLVSLNEELEIAKLNVELEQLRFQDKFLFEIDLDEEIDLKEYQIPPLILQPIIENSIWHGLLPLKDRRVAKLKIGVKVFPDFLHVTIEDNGVGRQPKKTGIGNIRESKGIEITKQRITNLNNYYNFKKADLIYEDLLDETGKPSGTKVTIVLPIIKKDQSDQS